MIRSSEFRDKYCKYQGAILKFGEGGDAVPGCCFKDEKLAQSWDDWQPCTAENCPIVKLEKGMKVE